MQAKTVYMKLCGVSLLWGCNYVASAYMLRDFSPILLSFIRLIVMSLFLIAVAAFHGKLRRPSAKEWRLLLLAGVFGTLLNQFFYFTGLQYSTAGNAALLNALSPIATMLLARIFLKDAVTGLKLFGGLVALAGVAGIVLYGGSAFGVSAGDVLLLGAMLAMSIGLLFVRRLTAAMTSYEVTIYSTVLGTALMIPAAGWAGLHGQTHVSHHLFTWVLLVVVAVVGQGVTGFWWNAGIAVVGPSASAMFMNIPPFVALIVGHLVLGDPIHAVQLLGGFLILLGVTVTNLGGRRLVRTAPAVQSPTSGELGI